jgi:hypothetical protein
MNGDHRILVAKLDVTADLSTKHFDVLIFFVFLKILLFFIQPFFRPHKISVNFPKFPRIQKNYAAFDPSYPEASNPSWYLGRRSTFFP